MPIGVVLDVAGWVLVASWNAAEEEVEEHRKSEEEQDGGSGEAAFLGDDADDKEDGAERHQRDRDPPAYRSGHPLTPVHVWTLHRPSRVAKA